MKLLLAVVATVLLYSVAYADLKSPPPAKAVVIAPVPSVPEQLNQKKKPGGSAYCEKLKGPEKLCIPKHEKSCLCGKE